MSDTKNRIIELVHFHILTKEGTRVHVLGWDKGAVFDVVGVCRDDKIEIRRRSGGCWAIDKNRLYLAKSAQSDFNKLKLKIISELDLIESGY
jgi:hypothetical protein